MSVPCNGGNHRHALTWQGSRRREFLSDRCNSQLLWASAARAFLLDRQPRLDGKSLEWTSVGAWEYLLSCPPKWRAGLTKPE